MDSVYFEVYEANFTLIWFLGMLIATHRAIITNQRFKIQTTLHESYKSNEYILQLHSIV